MAKTDADKLRAMVDAGRLRGDAAIEILEEWEPEVQAWAEAFAEIAGAITNARDAIEQYGATAEREERGEARDNAFEVIE